MARGANIAFKALCYIHHWTREERYYLFVGTPMAGVFAEPVEITEQEAEKLAEMFEVKIATSNVFGGGR